MSILYNLAWYGALTSDIIATVGLVYLLLSLPKMRNALKKSMTILFIAAFFAVASSTTLAIFGILKLNLQHSAWNLFILLFPIATIFFVISMRSLVLLFENLIESKKQQIQETG